MRRLRDELAAYILFLSLLIVNEKQHFSGLSFAPSSGFLRTQLVSNAFCALSKAIVPNFSQ